MNLTEVFNQEGKTIQRSFEITEEMVQEFSLSENRIIDFVITNIGKGKILVEGKGSLEAEVCCDRCLAPTRVILPLSFTREIYSPECIPDEDTAAEQYYLEGYNLALDALIKEEILMVQPTKILCKDDCKGICKKCGINLNHKQCECDVFIPDVRFAGLMELLNQ